LSYFPLLLSMLHWHTTAPELPRSYRNPSVSFLGFSLRFLAVPHIFWNMWSLLNNCHLIHKLWAYHSPNI
jgi:hypothetical protein